MVIAIYVLTLLISSSLLFLVQPMFAKMVLPRLGGTPAVWNTCMLFFQAALLAGYLYADLATRWLGARKQAVFHIFVLAAALLFLPLGIRDSWVPTAEQNPIIWLLMLLSATIGVPFLVVSASAPLFQRWFSATGHPSASDPYFLYSASNLGSMSALLAYPLIIEPLLTLSQQSQLWTTGYVMLVSCAIGCAICVWRARPSTLIANVSAVDQSTPSIAWKRRLRWIALAFVPSSLMLGATTYITTDLAVVPLLWVIPLALYLLTFILVFARREKTPHTWMMKLLPPALLLLVVLLLVRVALPPALLIGGHLAAFFVIALVCHGEIADDRPPPVHLTEYYLLMSVGGVLGGLFNAVIAPLVFNSIAEYPLAIVAGCFLWRPSQALLSGSSKDHGKGMFSAMIPAIGVGAIAVGAIMLCDRLGLPQGALRQLLTVFVPVLLCLALLRKSMRFGLGVAAVLLASNFSRSDDGQRIENQRSFFGVNRIARRVETADPTMPLAAVNMLYHGTTLHGQQAIDLQTLLPIRPRGGLGYYHPDGPIGRFFAAYADRQPVEIGLIGLGTGGLAAYGEPGQRMTYFEIDAAVQRMAEDTRYFTFVSEARKRGVDLRIILGDARLTLNRYDGPPFDLLILDAFSSDAIPVHLLTREAVAMYVSRLSRQGVIVAHISNRYLNLRPVVANIAADLGLACAINDDVKVTLAQMNQTGHAASTWVAMAKSSDDLAPLNVDGVDSPWKSLKPHPEAGARVWSDDYVNIFGALNWK